MARKRRMRKLAARAATKEATEEVKAAPKKEVVKEPVVEAAPEPVVVQEPVVEEEPKKTRRLWSRKSSTEE